MNFKENRDRTGTLRGYWDDAGKAHPLSAVYTTDENGDLTTALRDDITIVPATQAEIDEIKAKVAAMEAAEAANQYKVERAKAYPDFRDYLDGVVKGDQSQIDAYIAACQAVKAQFPKP